MELDARQYLEIVRSLGKHYPIFDSHAHPFDLFLNGYDYRRDPGDEMLLTVGGTQYVSPEIGKLASPAVSPMGESASPRALEQASILKLRWTYRHTGPKVFLDSMALAGIHRSVLLPPVREIGGVSATELMWQLFGEDPRFILGYSVPDDVTDDEILTDISKAKERFGVRVVKVYPSISRLDLSRRAALARVGRILSAASQNEMIFMIHGGLSPAAADVATREFGAIRHLQSIDWTLSRCPVIIAHCGTFGVVSDDARAEVLPLLSKMLEKHDHLMADVSGLDVNQMVAVLQSIDTARLVFGSDALYFPQWESMVNLCSAMIRCHLDLEEALLGVTSLQPAQLFA